MKTRQWTLHFDQGCDVINVSGMRGNRVHYVTSPIFLLFICKERTKHGCALTSTNWSKDVDPQAHVCCLNIDSRNNVRQPSNRPSARFISASVFTPVYFFVWVPCNSDTLVDCCESDERILPESRRAGLRTCHQCVKVDKVVPWRALCKLIFSVITLPTPYTTPQQPIKIIK